MPRPNRNSRDGQRNVSPAQMAVWASLLVLITLLWGNSFIAIKYVVRYVTPLELVTVRFVPVAITFTIILLPKYRSGVWSIIRNEWWRLMLLGLTGAVLYNVFLSWGETRVAAGTASLIITLNPAFIYTLAVLFLKEQFSWGRVLGLAVAFGGVFVIVRWGSGRAVTLDDIGFAGITMLAPAMWAIFTVTGKTIVTRYPPLLVTGISMTFAGLFSLVFIRPSFAKLLPAFPVLFWWAVLFLALPCTVFAFYIWFAALERLSAARVASFVYLVPMFGVTFSRWLLNESITPALILGGIILIVGIWLVNRR
ncbi:MAG: DMT family transporter [Gemmatimonadota bacterium]|nr:MAG: DMT family transporter [Gemmatimonadota bacterium]